MLVPIFEVSMRVRKSGFLFPLGTVSAIVVLSSSASAFSSEEHTWISDRGACVAKEVLDAEARSGADHDAATATRRSEVRAVLDSLSDPNAKVTYGSIAAYPDFVRSADNLLLIPANGKRDADAKPAAYRDSQPESPRRPPGRERINLQEVARRPHWFLASAAELSSNPHHFRPINGRVFWNGHLAAIDRARGGAPEDLWEALALNAYHDHFLQDLLAPGHITQRDSGKSQMETLRVHDRDNAAGRNFHLNREWWQSKISSPGISAHVRTCLPPASVADEELSGGHRTESWGFIEFKGDNSLVKGGRVQKGQWRQVELMIEISARSILDVAYSYVHLGEQPANSFEAIIHDDASGKFGFDGGEFDTKERKLTPRGFLLQQLAVGITLDRAHGVARKVPFGYVNFTVPPLGIDAFDDYAAIEIAPGYSGLLSGAYDGHGPDLRAGIRFEKMHAFIGGQFGWRWYKGEGRDSSRPMIAGIFGFGVGPIWTHFSVARDTTITARGIRTDPTTWGFGITILGPETVFAHFWP